MPLKLLALVTGGRRLRMEPSESVLLHGRGSSDFISLSVLLWRLPEARFKLSRLPLQGREESVRTSSGKGQQQDLQVPRQAAEPGQQLAPRHGTLALCVGICQHPPTLGHSFLGHAL